MEKLLIIDDEKSLVDLLALVFKKEGYAVRTALSAVKGLKAGALYYVVKPFDVDELKIIVARGLEKRRLTEENILLKRDFKERYSFEHMVGKSRSMQEIYGLIE